MKTFSCLVFAVALCLSLSAVQAQLQCEGDVSAARLTELLQASPTDECRSQMLTLVRVQLQNRFVEEAATVFQALSSICEPVCLKYVRMVAVECLPSYTTLLALACGKNERSTFCYQTIAINNGSSLLEACEPTPSQVASGQLCSNACRGALEEFRAFQGCCVTNAFNTTAFGLETFGIANYTLWSSCEVETVLGTCASPFVDTTTAGPTDSSYTLTAHGILSLLVVVAVFLLII